VSSIVGSSQAKDLPLPEINEMNHALGIQNLVEAIDSGNRKASLNDDLIAAEMAMARTRVGIGKRFIDRIRVWLAAIGTKLAKRPETLEQSVARLASVSPHLLDDIGLNADGHLSIVEDVPAGRGLVCTRLVGVDARAPKPVAIATNRVVHVGRSSGHPFGSIAAAE
jgi:hypothetical protein